MQLTSKFILIVVALAYGATAVSAFSVRGESSLVARMAEYEDLNAREIDNAELFVRNPFSFFGFGTPSRSSTPTPETDNSHTGAGLSRTKSETFSDISSLHSTEPKTEPKTEPPVMSKKVKKGRGPRYDPKPTMDVASRRQFRKDAAQNSALLKEASKDKNHPYHSTAIHMKKEDAVRNNPKLLKQALNDPNHALHSSAHTVKAQTFRQKKSMRAALKDENHPLHEAAVAHRNNQHDQTIRNADPKLVEAALANKNHKLHAAAHRVAAQNNVDAFDALPQGY